MSEVPATGARRPGRFIVLGILILAFGALFVGLYGAASRKPSDEFVVVNGVNDQQRIFGGVRQTDQVLGEDDAEVQIQIFTDVQCEECKDQFDETVPPLVNNQVRDGDVALLYRNRSLNENATEIGFYGIEAAAEQGYGWQYAYLLFQNQQQAKVKQLNQQFLTTIAESITHLDILKWTKAYTQGIKPDSEMTQTLEDQDKYAFGLKIRAQPAAVVSGPNGTRVVQDSPDLAQIEQAINEVR